MIKNKSPERLLVRNSFGTSISQSDIKSFWENMILYVNDSISETNSINNGILYTLDNVASESENIANKIGILANKLADLYVVSGKTNTTIDIFTDELKYSTTNMIADADQRVVRLSNNSNNSLVIKNLDINIQNGSTGNRVEYDSIYYSDVNNILGDASRLEIESISSPAIFSMDIDLGSSKIVNMISMNIFNFGTGYPSIESIEVSESGCKWTPQKILVSNSTKVNLNDINLDSTLELQFKETKARYLRVNMIQENSYMVGDVRRYAVGINNLSVNLVESEESGSIVFGPYTSHDEILKVSISADVVQGKGDNISYSISNNKTDWIPISNSSYYSEDRDVIINFNNIDLSSIQTNNPTKEIYLKIDFMSFDSDLSMGLDDKVERFTGVINKTSNILNVSFDSTLDNTKIYESMGPRYGSQSRIGDKHYSDPASIIEAYGESWAVNSSEGYVLDDSITYAVNTRPDRLFVEEKDLIIGYTSNDFDINDLKVFDLSKPIIVNQRVATNKNNEFTPGKFIPVIELSAYKGSYTVETDSSTFSINIDDGFLYSNLENLYELSENTSYIKVYNEIGELVSNTAPFNLNGRKLLILTDVFGYTPIGNEDMVYNPLYPLVALSDNEFGVLYNKIVTGSPYNSSIILTFITRNTIDALSISGFNSNRVLLHSNKKIKAGYSLLEYDMKKKIKLQDTNILEGSIKFNISDASVNSFIREVEYIDGVQEFNLPIRYTQYNNANLNIIQLNSGFVDDDSIRFGECSECFQRRVYSSSELVDKGDYYIDVSNTAPRIILPEGVYTPDIYDTKITYNIKDNIKSNNGLYSVNYRRGIIYTSDYIDGNTKIEYLYSHIYAEYDPLSQFDREEIKIENGIAYINNSKEEFTPVVAIVNKNNQENQKIKLSPVLKDIKMNLITDGDFL